MPLTQTPLATRIVVFKRKPERINLVVATRARRVFPMDLQALANRRLINTRHLCGDFPNVRNRQTRVLTEHCAEYPDTAGDRGCPRPIGCNRLDARLRHDAAAMAFGCNRHTAEGISLDTRDVVKPRHPLVNHHKVRLDQVTNIQIVVQNLGEKRLGFTHHRCF